MITIVHVVWTLDVGGLEQVVLDLARRCDATRFSSRVICMAEPGAMASQFAAAGIPVDSIGDSTLSTPRRLARMVRRLRAIRPDVVHTHNVKPHVQGTIASALAGVPVVVNTKHGRNYPTSLIAVTVDRLLSRVCDRMIAVSADAARIAAQIDWMPARKIQVIRNGVDLSRHSVVTSADPARLCRVVTVARLNPIKDQATLLRAMRIVIDADPRFHLTIAGEGPSREALQQLCCDLGLEQHVSFLGYQPDVPAVLAEAGQFVLPSISEGVSLTLLEAMAAGLPVVATQVGGTPEIVEHGSTGWLVPPSDPEALAAALLRIVREPERSAAMGREGRARVEQHFSVATAVERYQKTYAELSRGATASVDVMQDAVSETF